MTEVRGLAERMSWQRGAVCRAFAGAWLVAALLPAGCVAHEQRGVPLYSPADPPLPRESVARVVGYVRYVDGADLAKEGRKGRTFEVLPGCHLVGTPSSWGTTEGPQGGVAVPTGRVDYAMPMRAGHEYVIDVFVQDSSSSTGAAELRAYERSPGGAITRTFSPIRSQADVTACQQAAPAEASARGAPQR